MKLKCLIFDFDGTIADTYSIIFEIISEIFHKRGVKIPKDRKEPRSMGAREKMRKYKISRRTVVLLTRVCRRHLKKKIKTVKTFPRLKNVLKKLKKKYRLGIVTSNSKNNVKIFLKNNGLNEVFDFIETGNPLFGKHRRLKKAVKRHGYKKSEVIYVGDETRDIKAAKKVGVKIVAVSWGYESISCLNKGKPNYLITKPERLLKIV